MELPLWFLLLSLLLPRISLIAAYFSGNLTPYNLTGWLPPILGVVIPRVLVIVFIVQDRGMSWWLLVHGLALACVYERSHTMTRTIYVRNE